MMKGRLFLSYCILLVLLSQSVSAQIISTIAGTGFAGYGGDGGPATSALLDSPTALSFDGAGNLFISDQFNNRIRRVATSGIITSIAGNGTIGYSGDGGPATSASLAQNWGVVSDKQGNVYVSDPIFNRVRKIATNGIITTVAGNGIYGYSGDGGPATAASLRVPVGLSLDNEGNLYIGDADNHCIRKVGLDGIISTYAGIGGLSLDMYSGDGGPATAARLGYIWGLATDKDGHLYICDGGQNDRIRKVDAISKIITTVAGDGGHGFSGDGVPATSTSLNEPLAITVLPNGTMYIADCRNNRIRKVGTDGIISTIAGTGVEGYNGDGIPATVARIHHPTGVYVDSVENVYFSDLLNVRIRKVSNVLYFVKGEEVKLSACKDDMVVSLDSLLAIRDIYVGLTDDWTLHSVPTNGIVFASYSTISTGGTISPTGMYYTPNPGFVGIDSFYIKVSNVLSHDIIKVKVEVESVVMPSNIIGASFVCLNDTVHLYNSVAGGNWESFSGKVAISKLNTNEAYVRGLSVGVDTVFYTISTACGSASVSKTFTINPLPDPGVLVGPDGVCLTDTIRILASVPGGIWAINNSNATITSSGLVRGVIQGNASVIYTVSNAWCSLSGYKNISVDTFPQTATIIGPSTICVGEQQVYVADVIGGIWSVSSALSTVNDGAVVAVKEGLEFINYNITNACGTSYATLPVLIHAKPAQPVITLDKGYLAAPEGYRSYQWQVDGRILSSALSDTLGIIFAGKYLVTVTNEFGCKSSSDTLTYDGCDPATIKIYPNPAKAIVNIDWCRKLTIRLITADGKMVFSTSSTDTINLSNLASGVYFLELYDYNGKKLSVEKLVHNR